MTSIGDTVIEAVVRADALQEAHLGENGGTVFVWRANAAEQIEAALQKPFNKMTLDAVNDDALVTEALAMSAAGRAIGDDAMTIMRCVLAGFMMRVLVDPIPGNKDD